MVRGVFVVDADGVFYPALEAAVPDDVATVATREASSDEAGASGDASAVQRVLRRFETAERDELIADRLETALAGYQACAQSDAPAPLRALAWSRTARVATKLGRHDVARTAFETLVTAYEQESDLFGQPFGLSAQLALAEQGGADAADTARLAKAYDGLVTGVWPVDAEQAGYFVAAFEARLGRSAAARPATPFLDDFEIAQALQRRADLRVQAPAGEVVATSLVPDGRFPGFYASGPGRTNVVLAADLDWVAEHLVPDAVAELQVAGAARLVPPGRDVAESTGSVRLRDVLAGWWLVLSPDGGGGASASRRELFVTTGTIVVVVVALGLGLVLLQRDISRDAEMNVLRQDFVAGVSHDLKTPVTLIRLYAEALDDDPGAPEDDRRGFYQIILRESERLSRLVERIVGFSRAERGARTWTLTPSRLDAILSSALDTYGPYLKRRGFECRVEIAPGTPPVLADAEAVVEAVVNLLDNAVKYSGESREVIVRLLSRGAEVVVEVEDHGIGIDAEEHGRVFDRFYRSQRTEGQGGYGLGLFLVKHIMDAHDGRIEVESERGRGSCFRLVFPAAGDTSAAGTEKDDAEDPGR
jgi:signal transduction histidine kinase